MVKKIGEPVMIVACMVMVGISLAPLPFLKTSNDSHKVFLLLTLGLLSIGSSLLRPPVFGLISVLAAKGEQGLTLGVAQSAGSMARIVGPFFAVPLYYRNPGIPYVSCSVISIVTAIVAMQTLSHAGDKLAVGKETADSSN